MKTSTQGLILCIIGLLLLFKQGIYVIYGLGLYLFGLIMINYSRVLISVLIIFSLLFIAPVIYVYNTDNTHIGLGISQGKPYTIWSVTTYTNDKPTIGDYGRYYDDITGWVAHKIIDENKENFTITDTFTIEEINKKNINQKRIKKYPIITTNNFLLACYWETIILNIPMDCWGLYYEKEK